ncbi:alpha/beta fold hydrolase [Piscinibacter sp. XHJ-5]|uniref:alpha/beta hydrolase n=1 Tax=Piscinibacter sp. XHJ-5 TaxID=3037797 RepID=UPI0024529EFF|nr:alpha/beta fold hydrolase [Piscinibacter sp. XHJ-5]
MAGLRVLVLPAFALAGCAAAPWAPDIPALAVDEFHVPSKSAGIELFVRNKRVKGAQAFPSSRIVLFVHGVTFPSESTFDLSLDGLSWMDYIARAGYDVYLVDVRGYGGSTRPAAMSEPPDRNPPVATLAEAVDDVDAAVDFIRRRRHVERINLIGWSWGTAIMGRYAASHGDKVERLVLYAPVWQRTTQSPAAPGTDAKTAYRLVNVAAARSRWLAGVARDKQEQLVPRGWFETWVAANLATDPWGSNRLPPVMRAPNGGLPAPQPSGDWVPPYDPVLIKAPTLLVKGEWDADTPSSMAQALFPLLANAPVKQYVEIGEGTHSIMLERNRMQLFRVVLSFLDGPND